MTLFGRRIAKSLVSNKLIKDSRKRFSHNNYAYGNKVDDTNKALDHTNSQ